MVLNKDAEKWLTENDPEYNNWRKRGRMDYPYLTERQMEARRQVEVATDPAELPHVFSGAGGSSHKGVRPNVVKISPHPDDGRVNKLYYADTRKDCHIEPPERPYKKEEVIIERQYVCAAVPKVTSRELYEKLRRISLEAYRERRQILQDRGL